MKARSILFVCTGNTCRSPMAEYLLRHMLQKEELSHVEVISRGIHAGLRQPMTPKALQVLGNLGIPAESHRTAMLSASDITKAHQIYGMTEEHVSIILERHPEARGKTRRLGPVDIEDPMGGSLSDYEKCRIEIQNALLDLILKLKSEGSPTP